MTTKFSYRLGLDLGTHSIGWAVLPLNEQGKPKAIANTGVRIFSDGRHPKTGTSLAVERRHARQMRRRRDRVLKRTRRLIMQLTEFGFLPDSHAERSSLASLNPYELRAKGLDHALQPHEFGRIMLHLSKRRGFKSNRKTDRNDNELGVMHKAIRTLEDRLKTENCRTLGEWLAKRHERGESVRARLRGTRKDDKAYDFYATRIMTEHELKTLWEKQSSFNPEQYNANAREKLLDTLLFQRELLPVKPGRCTLIPEQYRAPLALPSVQRFRILQELNNLKIVNLDQTESKLTLEQRTRLLDLLLKQKNVSFPKLRTTLKLPKTVKFNLETIARATLKGDLTTIQIADISVFGNKWADFSLQQQDDIVMLLLTESDENELIEKLSQNFQISKEQGQLLADIQLSEGYGRLSKQAIDKILPSLEKSVISYSDAVEEAGLGSHSALSNLEKTGEIFNKLPYYGIPLKRHVAFEKDDPKTDEDKYGKISNPTVHICLNQLRVVVNAIIKKYGPPQQIHVEVTRDLKIGTEEKKKIAKYQADRKKINDKFVAEACEILKLEPDAIDRSKRRELSQKMQLWQELNPSDVAERRCPFSGEQISITRLLSAEVEIEHILPYSRTLDDSMANKTLAIAKANRAKGNRTPWEAFGNNAHPDFDYEDILRRANLLPLPKARRFGPQGLENWAGKDGFLARALTDTAYTSRLAREYLACICPLNHIVAVPGRLTGMIRGKLGLNDLIKDNNGKKNREDHRHHAIDAIVVAITERQFLSQVAHANARAKESGSVRLIEDMPLPWPTFYGHAKRTIDNILTSHRPDHGYHGQMMEDTAWGIVDSKKVRRRTRDESTGHRKIEYANKNVIGITEVRQRERHGLDSDGNPNAYKGYVGGNNYCIEIYKDDDKWKGSIISTFEAYQIIREYGEKKGLKKLRDRKLSLCGKPLVMRLMRDDFVEFYNGDSLQIYRLVVISGSGQLSFSPPNESNVDRRNRDKSLRYVSKTAGSLQKSKARHCTINPIGKLTRHRPTV